MSYGIEKKSSDSCMYSSLYKELLSLPVVQSAGELYLQTKQSSTVLNTGLAVLEYSCTTVIERLFIGSKVDKLPSSLVNLQKNPTLKMDMLAGEGMAKLKETYPSLRKSPAELQDSTSYMMRKTVRTVMQTGPGKKLIGGLDWVIDKTGAYLKRVKPRQRSPRKRKATRSTVKKNSPDHNYASEDSGACDAEVRPSHKSQQTVLTSVKLMEESDESILKKAYKLGIVFPLDVLVHLLKSVRRYIGGKRRKSVEENVLSPEKEMEIGDRRKVSPRKRVTSTFWGRLRVRAYGLLGYPDASAKGLKLDSSEPLSPGKIEAEKKRKHDEILTDQGSDSEIEDLSNFDFDNYESEEDPDYQPTDSNSGTSEDMSDDGDSESDIETETVDTRASLPAPLVQIKEKDDDFAAKKREQREKIMADIKKLGESKEPFTNGHSDDKKETKPGPSPPKKELCLKPQWQKETDVKSAVI